MQVETGMPVASAFLLVGGASSAFVAGGVMVFSTLLLSLAQPLPLVIVFSTSSFIFICTALMELFRHSQSGYTDVLLVDTPGDPTAAGLGQLFAIMSLILGVIMLYTVDALIYRVSVLAADCYGEAGLPQRQRHAGAVVTRGSFSTLDLAVSGCSSELHAASALRYDHFHGAELPEISTSASPYEPFSVQSTGFRVRGTILSVVAVILHHIPEGLALYVAAIRHLHMGVAVALGVVLHSLPDGIALASSIYFASGHRVRGVLWCLLSPVGKLCGALVAWVLVGHSEDDHLKHAIATGIAAGVLLGVGVKEVMPTTHSYAVGKAHGTAIGLVVGMAIVGATKLMT